MFLLFITILYFIGYFGLSLIYSLFFTGKMPRFSRSTLGSLIIIFLLNALSVFIVSRIPDVELGNRFQHGFGGGVVAFIICILVAKDIKIPVSKIQFIIFSLLIVCALGVANELLEFWLQQVTPIIFAPSIEDTWFDLLSNTIGMTVGMLASLPFLGKLLNTTTK